MSKRIAFGWYGGKFSHLNTLLPHLPEAKHFVDVFGGSAAVIMNAGPYPIETYNDVDGEVVNFFRILRDNPDELIRRIGLTPYARAEFIAACTHTSTDPIECARMFYVRARMSRSGLAQQKDPARWSYCKAGHTVRRSVSISVSRWLGGVEKLADVATRLQTVQIEQLPALRILDKYDTADTLFYCDPPYMMSTRTGTRECYANEMTDAEHAELLGKLRTVQGKVAVSGYPSERYASALHDWRQVAWGVSSPTSRKQRTECLWMNY